MGHKINIIEKRYILLFEATNPHSLLTLKIINNVFRSPEILEKLDYIFQLIMLINIYRFI